MTNANTIDGAAMTELDREECLVLLRWEVIGRLAVAVPGEAPSVVPVNFAVHDGAVLFRSGEGEKLRHLRDHPVSLQVDRFDLYRRIGWSVLVKGMAVEVDPDLVDDLDIEPWAPAAKEHLLRLDPDQITGRRLVLRQAPLDGRAYL